MGSTFSNSASKRASPSWCKKGTWLGLLALIAGRPKRLAVYARWTNLVYGIDINRIESFQLSYNAETGDWSGSSGERGENLAVEIATLGTAGYYDIDLDLRYDREVDTSHTWSNIRIPNKWPFDTGHLKHVIDGTNWFYELHAKG